MALSSIGNYGKLCGTIWTLVGNRHFYMKLLKMGLAGIVFSCIFILVSLGKKKSDLQKPLEKSDLTVTYRMDIFKGQLWLREASLLCFPCQSVASVDRQNLLQQAIQSRNQLGVLLITHWRSWIIVPTPGTQGDKYSWVRLTPVFPAPSTPVTPCKVQGSVCADSLVFTPRSTTGRLFFDFIYYWVGWLHRPGFITSKYF